MPDAAINASDAPRKIVHLLTSLSEANSMVASCVLSPVAAMKTEMKTVASIFQSMTNPQLMLRLRRTGHSLPSSEMVLFQSEHILHVVHACRMRLQKTRCAQRAQRESGAAAGFVGDFDALSRAGEQHGQGGHEGCAAARG